MAQDYPKVWMDEHGIIHVLWGHGTVSLADIRQAVEQHRAISTTPRPVLIYTYAGDAVSMEWDALEFANSPEVVAITAASGLLVQSFMQHHIARMFLWYHKPPYPSQIFRKREDAIDWLKQFVPKAETSST